MRALFAALSALPLAAAQGFGGSCDCDPEGCASLGGECVAKKVLWLPLGDSITWGCNGATLQDCHNDAAGYRIPLALALTQHPLGNSSGMGFNITTMGTLETGPPYMPREWMRHEGHPGWTIPQVDAILNKSLATSPTPPDLITIHLGTNDVLHGQHPPQMKGSMTSLLAHIQAGAPQAQVFLSNVIGSGYRPDVEQRITAFNTWVPGIVKDFQAKGMRIFLVSSFEAMQQGCETTNSTSPYYDLCGAGRIHPTSAGYPRMASAFALSIMRNYKAA